TGSRPPPGRRAMKTEAKGCRAQGALLQGGRREVGRAVASTCPSSRPSTRRGEGESTGSRRSHERERNKKKSGPKAAFPQTPRNLLLLGSDHHAHLAAFQAREGLHHAVLADVFLDLLGQVLAQVLMGHFTAAETDGDLDLVAFLEEAKHVAQLDLV